MLPVGPLVPGSVPERDWDLSCRAAFSGSQSRPAIVVEGRGPTLLFRLLIEIACDTIFARSWVPWIRYVVLLVFVLVTAGRVVLGGPLPLSW